MNMEKIIKFGDIAPKKQANDKQFVPIGTVLGKKIVINKIEWSSYNNDPVMILYTSMGNIRTGSGILMKQIKEIENQLGDSPLETTIVSNFNKNGKTYYTFQ